MAPKPKKADASRRYTVATDADVDACMKLVGATDREMKYGEVNALFSPKTARICPFRILLPGTFKPLLVTDDARRHCPTDADLVAIITAEKIPITDLVVASQIEVPSLRKYGKPQDAEVVCLWAMVHAVQKDQKSTKLWPLSTSAIDAAFKVWAGTKTNAKEELYRVIKSGNRALIPNGSHVPIFPPAWYKRQLKWNGSQFKSAFRSAEDLQETIDSAPNGEPIKVAAIRQWADDATCAKELDQILTDYNLHEKHSRKTLKAAAEASKKRAPKKDDETEGGGGGGATDEAEDAGDDEASDDDGSQEAETAADTVKEFEENATAEADDPKAFADELKSADIFVPNAKTTVAIEAFNLAGKYAALSTSVSADVVPRAGYDFDRLVKFGRMHTAATKALIKRGGGKNKFTQIGPKTVKALITHGAVGATSLHDITRPFHLYAFSKLVGITPAQLAKVPWACHVFAAIEKGLAAETKVSSAPPVAPEPAAASTAAAASPPKPAKANGATKKEEESQSKKDDDEDDPQKDGDFAASDGTENDSDDERPTKPKRRKPKRKAEDSAPAAAASSSAASAASDGAVPGPAAKKQKVLWTAEEEARLMKLLEEESSNAHRFSVVAGKMNRTLTACRQKYNDLRKRSAPPKQPEKPSPTLEVPAVSTAAATSTASAASTATATVSTPASAGITSEDIDAAFAPADGNDAEIQQKAAAAVAAAQKAATDAAAAPLTDSGNAPEM